MSSPGPSLNVVIYFASVIEWFDCISTLKIGLKDTVCGKKDEALRLCAASFSCIAPWSAG